jgi:Mor family transcriptional regulator
VVFASTKIKFWRSRDMKYLKAQNLLPEEVIRIIQEYVDGEFIYIPRKNCNQKAWGEKSGAKDSLKERNIQIYTEYKSGVKVSDLSKTNYLSEQSIRRIISQEKACFSSSSHNHL